MVGYQDDHIYHASSILAGQLQLIKPQCSKGALYDMVKRSLLRYLLSSGSMNTRRFVPSYLTPESLPRPLIILLFSVISPNIPPPPPHFLTISLRPQRLLLPSIIFIPLPEKAAYLPTQSDACIVATLKTISASIAVFL